MASRITKASVCPSEIFVSNCLFQIVVSCGFGRPMHKMHFPTHVVNGESLLKELVRASTKMLSYYELLTLLTASACTLDMSVFYFLNF